MLKLTCKLGISLALTIGLFACATQQNEHETEFFGQSLNFVTARSGGSAEVYRADKLTPKLLAQYDSFMVDPVLIWYSDDSDYQGVFPDEMKAISDYMQYSITESLQQDYKVVNEPGPNVLRIRAAITNMKRRKPLRAINFIPIGAVVFGIEEIVGANKPTRKKIAQGNSYIIEATIVGGMYDSESGELLGAYKDFAKTEKGKEASSFDKEKGATWGQVKSAIDYWAKLLKLQIDNANSANHQGRNLE
ncbi:MAG: DUF3313 domain-containing protein [Oleispira sp.]|nr:DUF3313 domain-containing protein [Oleispira sp.]MBL4879870.1 DUF3313 domain-containing protein [Oleispira sp.]